mgnify:CR=1 FL=1
MALTLGLGVSNNGTTRGCLFITAILHGASFSAAANVKPTIPPPIIAALEFFFRQEKFYSFVS